jgi:S-adenosylmethionine-diacylglycerol 3-amino-3-carboxypropyl transferase
MTTDTVARGARSEIADRADFSAIRYAQCWEDADVLLAGLDVRPGDVCLSIASAGDNSLALLTRSPKRVIALDLNPAQFACADLRVAAYRELAHPELLELIGSTPSKRREDLYRRCRPLLDADARAFWDAHPAEVRAGIGGAGKFERYFGLFRRRVLPFVHSGCTVHRLLRGGSRAERFAFYRGSWDGWRWRLLFRVFFSRFVMGRLGRDPGFFTYVQGSVADHVIQRTRHALTELNPAENPYLQWIMTGRHLTALPLALRAEHFDTIRANIDRIEWHCASVEAFLDTARAEPIDCYNLSDIFEYMSEANYHQLLDRLVRHANPGARLAYWNMLVPRTRPESMADRLEPLTELSMELFARDKATFYSRFVIERVRGAA